MRLIIYTSASVILSLSALFSNTCSAVESGEAALMVHERYNENSWRLAVGITAPITQLQIDNPAGSSDVNEDTDSAIGYAVRLSKNWTRLRSGIRSHSFELGAQLAQHRGEIDNDKISANSAQIFFRPAWLGRKWFDSASGWSSFQLELGLIGGIGAGNIDIDSRGNTDPGLSYQLGIDVGMLWRRKSGKSYFLHAGYELHEILAKWNNTDTSSITASGLSIRLGMGW